MRFHIPGIPHTISNNDYVSCAFTQKVRKLCRMLSDLGHEVFHYGCEGSDVEATHVEVVGRNELLQQHPFEMDRMFQYDMGDTFHNSFYSRVTEEIAARRKPGDFLLCSWGLGHKPIVDRLAAAETDSAGGGGRLKEMFVVESGVGYNSIFSDFRVFESYFWMAHLYGKNNLDRGHWYDAVIPNAFDPEDFEFRERKEDYFLYLGRIVEDKGVDIALQTADALGAELVVAGQGESEAYLPGRRAAHPRARFVGFADRNRRRELLAGAKALFAPTYYLEPFGGVAVEAMMSGTPVITSDWGAFPETVIHGVTGYRCHTFDQFVHAAQSIGDLSPASCRRHAMENYSLERVAPMYETYFRMLADLNGKGWYERHPESNDANRWLHRAHPD